MTSLFLEMGENRVHYWRFGSGPRLLIALHGFGLSARQFAVLAPIVGGKYTVCAPDLPFHGRTEWRGDTFDQEDLEAVTLAILEREGQKSFSCLGFSYGGRLVLSTLPQFGSLIEALWLIAPDGLGTKGLAAPQVVPPVFRWLFAQVLREGRGLLRLARIMQRLSLLDDTTYRFLQRFLGNDRRRHCLVHTWLSLGHFRVYRQRVRRFLAAHPMPVHILLGDRDEYISIPGIRRFAAGLPEVHIRIRPVDHDSLVDRQTARWIQSQGNV